MYYPGLTEIQEMTEQGNICPIYREIVADLETPVSAYLKIARGQFSFLLESVEGGQHIARYSFLGSDPYMILRMQDGVAHATQGGYKQTLPYTDPLVVLESHVNSYRPIRLADLPLFVGGAVGYFSYETVCSFEDLPCPDPADYHMSTGLWMFVDTLLIFDHLRHKIKVLSHVHLDTPDLEAEYARAVQRIEELVTRLQQPVEQTVALHGLTEPRNYEPHSVSAAAGNASQLPSPVSSNITREQYEANVQQAKEYIAAGDIFQVVPSQRFRRPTHADSFTIYRALRTINPSPYMFYLRTDEGDLVGASPEMLVRVQEGEVVTHPIAGTRRRGRDMAEDAALAAELLADEKERAEHLMLVDLGRNDIGRVSIPGTVCVPEFMVIEKYSHVMHIVSHVTGKLRPDVSALDALRACFPAGTVSGAPKIRAMEIIAELEGSQRGVYAGCVGHVGFNGDLDTCISLRTMVVKDGVAYVQAGGGVAPTASPPTSIRRVATKPRHCSRLLISRRSLGHDDTVVRLRFRLKASVR